MAMKKIMFFVCTLVLMIPSVVSAADNVPFIEVTGSATVNIVPDRITVEIGMEEYYKQKVFGDSTIVRLADIEKNLRSTLRQACVPDSEIIISDMGNYRDRYVSDKILMAKRLSVTLSDFGTVETIADRIDRKGITSFNITKIDNTEIERYNRQGLKAALKAAREKADFIAENSGVVITMPYEIIETGPNYYETPSFSNVAFDSGSGMENMRRIVRRYSVKVRYLFTKE